jgi:hypothetical protein
MPNTRKNSKNKKFPPQGLFAGTMLENKAMKEALKSGERHSPTKTGAPRNRSWAEKTSLAARI